jgi:predicted HicB family RNase H-like nuclease
VAKPGRKNKYDEKMTSRVALLLTPDEHQRLLVMARQEDRSVSALIRRAMREKYPHVFAEEEIQLKKRK